MLLSPFFISCYVDMVDQGIHLAQNLKRKKENFEAFRQAQTQKLGEYLLTQDFLINNSIFFLISISKWNQPASIFFETVGSHDCFITGTDFTASTHQGSHSELNFCHLIKCKK